MEIGLITLAIILAVLLGWLLKQSFNTQPWVAEEVSATAHHGPLGGVANTRLIALLTLLAVVTSFFALILSAYSLRMELLIIPQRGNMSMIIVSSIGGNMSIWVPILPPDRYAHIPQTDITPLSGKLTF